MKKLLWMLFVALTTSALCQTKYDSTSVEFKIAKAFITSMNDKDIEAMREFTLNYRTEKALARTSIEDRLKSYQELKDKLGFLEFGPVDKVEPGNIKVFVYATSKDTWFKMGFKLGEKNKLESLSMIPTRNPNKGSNELGLDQQAESIVTDKLAPGVAMAVVKNGKIEKTIVHGVGNSTTNKPFSIKDPFHLGSVSKSFTACLIGKLIDEGKLKMDTPIRDIFPFEINAQYHEVTIRSVLAHEGGFPSYLVVEDKEDTRLLMLPGSAREQRLAFAKEILNQEPEYEPNSNMNYSNAGYSLLASICEIVANKTWESQLREVIFKPLKMKSAGIGWPTNVNPAFPEGHDENGKIQDTKEYFLGPYIQPSGDIHCSMRDLAKYAIAHLKGLNGEDTFISSNAIKEIHKFTKTNNYAGGWMSEEKEGKVIYFHPGSAGTYFSYIAIDPKSNSAFVIAANSGNPRLLGIFRDISNL